MSKLKLIQSIYLPFNDSGINLTSYLAIKAKDELLTQVLELGGKVSDAIYGYAIAGNELEVLSILSECTEKNSDLCKSMAIRGYARGGYDECIQKIENYRQYNDEIVIGLAQSGSKLSEVKVSSMLNRNNKLYEKAIIGYASTNNVKALNQLINGTSFYPTGIFHAARAGNVELVNDLLAQCGVKEWQKFIMPLGSKILINEYFLVNTAVRGYCQGRHFFAAISLLKCGANIMIALSELQGTNGLPNHDLYLALLAHIDDVAVRKLVLAQIEIKSKVNPTLKISMNDINPIEKKSACLDSLNYLEALECVNNKLNIDDVKSDGAISCKILADVISSYYPKEDNNLVL